MSPWAGPLTLGIAAALFVTGLAGVLVRRNAIVVFMSVELMMAAANLTLMAFAQRFGATEGRAVVFIALTVAAAEAGIGLAILVVLFRRAGTLDLDRLDSLRW